MPRDGPRPDAGELPPGDSRAYSHRGRCTGPVGGLESCRYRRGLMVEALPGTRAGCQGMNPGPLPGPSARRLKGCPVIEADAPALLVNPEPGRCRRGLLVNPEPGRRHSGPLVKALPVAGAGCQGMNPGPMPRTCRPAAPGLPGHRGRCTGPAGEPGTRPLPPWPAGEPGARPPPQWPTGESPTRCRRRVPRDEPRPDAANLPPGGSRTSRSSRPMHRPCW